jgi:hypothetical protein
VALQEWLMKKMQLTPIDQQRIESIAEAAGCSAEHALAFVLRDGFDETERVLRAVVRARSSVASQGTLEHSVAMERLNEMLSRHVAKSNQAA